MSERMKVLYRGVIFDTLQGEDVDQTKRLYNHRFDAEQAAERLSVSNGLTARRYKIRVAIESIQ